MTRVIVAATSAVVRAGLETLVGARDQFTVAGSAADIESLLRQVEASHTDVILLDFGPGTEEAVSALSSLGDELSPPVIIALTNEARGSWVSEAFHSRLRAILPQEAEADMIAAAIEAVAAGLLVLTPDALDLINTDDGAVADSELDSSIEALTPREVEVLGMLAEGSANKTIAYRLGISEHTVKFHVASIFSKLGVSSRTEAVTVGIRRGLIML